VSVINTKEWGKPAPGVEHALLPLLSGHYLPVMLFWLRGVDACLVSPAVAMNHDRLRAYLGTMRRFADWCEHRETFVLDRKRVNERLLPSHQHYVEPPQRKHAKLPNLLAHLGYTDAVGSSGDGVLRNLPTSQRAQVTPSVDCTVTPVLVDVR